MWNARLDDSQAGIKIAGRNINNLRYTDDITLMAESEEELKSLLMRVKEESETAGLKHNINKTKMGIVSHHFMANGWEKRGNSNRFYFLGLQNHCESWTLHAIKRCLLLGRKAMTNLVVVQLLSHVWLFVIPWTAARQASSLSLFPGVCSDSCPLSRWCHPTMSKAETSLCWQSPYSQTYGFSSSHVWKWELDLKESWTRKNWCLRTVMLEKTLESPLQRKEIKLINSKGNKHWIFIGRTDAEAPILWPPDVRSLLIGKDSDARKDWGQKEKEVTEDWDGWMASLPNGYEFEQTQGDNEGQGSLVCCSSWGYKESDTT